MFLTGSMKRLAWLVVLLGAAQAYYVGPIALWLSRPFGMDVGFEPGLIFAGVAYYFLRRIEIAQFRR